MTEPVVQKGDILIAAMALADPNFQHTVVLICEHDDDSGTYGLILNRQLAVTRELREEVPFVGDRLFQGGPVRKEALQILHPYGDRVANSRRVLDGVWLGADFEALESGFASGIYDADACRFFLGYAGWDKDQLAKEFELGTWVKVRGSAELIFHTAPSKMWNKAVQVRGKADPLFAHFPDNPKWN